ncbi:MAG: response regulator [Pacificimonas sp.]
MSGRHILLVEDEILIAMDIESELEERGAIVRGPVTRLAEGLPISEDAAELLDAAILDVNLRGEDVFPIAERLASRGVPFLFHTGHADREDLRARFETAPVCNKPVQTEALVDEVERLLANAA